MPKKNEPETALGLSKILEGFEYIPGQINARIVKEHDGRDALQIRDLTGLHQYETDGNPLGVVVEEKFESYLDYLEHLLNEYIDKKKNDEGFHLQETVCEVLRIEGLRYYERYVSFFMLEEFEKSARDSDRNIRLFDIMSKYASESYKNYFAQYQPYILSINARAKCLKQVKDGNRERALEIAEEGLKKIEVFFAQNGIEDGTLSNYQEISCIFIFDMVSS